MVASDTLGLNSFTFFEGDNAENREVDSLWGTDIDANEPEDPLRGALKDIDDSRVFLGAIDDVEPCRGTRDVDGAGFEVLSTLLITPNSFGVSVGPGDGSAERGKLLVLATLRRMLDVCFKGGGEAAPSAELRLEMRGILVGVSLTIPLVPEDELGSLVSLPLD